MTTTMTLRAPCTVCGEIMTCRGDCEVCGERAWTHVEDSHVARNTARVWDCQAVRCDPGGHVLMRTRAIR